uniref:Peptidase M12B propeptide domain-containing protein n=1 Tax=Latimeria chalumnae TaxID=7897 RepID=H3B4Z3_LATCH
MLCIQEGWFVSIPFLVQFLSFLASSHGSNLQLGNIHFPVKQQEHFIQSLQDYEVVHPVKVNHDGHFLSHNISHHVSYIRRKRDIGNKENPVYYKINHKGENLFFNLTANQDIISDSYVLERRYGSLSGAKIGSYSGNSCHLTGTVLLQESVKGTAAISTCSGLVRHSLL